MSDPDLRLQGFGVCEPGPDARYIEDDYRLAPSLGLALVSSGMGAIGGQGRPSAKLAIWSVVGQAETVGRFQNTSPLECMRGGLLRADAAISRLFHGSEVQPPPTSFAGVAVSPTGAGVIAHIGCARAYHLRGTELLHATREHTLAQAYPELELGDDHQYAKVITRALGYADKGLPELTERSFALGDRVLLCTRHIRDVLDDDALLDIATRPSLDQAWAQLDALLREHVDRNRYYANTLVLVELAHAMPTQADEGASHRPVNSWLFAPGEPLANPPGVWRGPDAAWFREVYALVMGEDG